MSESRITIYFLNGKWIAEKKGMLPFSGIMPLCKENRCCRK
ncbi:hypothetical protein [Peribacillus frigoritolerans]